MKSAELFINRHGNLRSGWRFFIFLLSFLFLGGFISLAIKLILANLGVNYSVSSLIFISINSAVSLVTAIVLGWLWGKHLENLPFRALGASFTENWLKDLIFGMLLGSGTLIFAVLMGILFGGLRFTFNEARNGQAIVETLAVSLGVFILGAAFEEAFFRGYILQTFARARLAWLAILLTSVFFAFGHLGNTNANHLSTLNTILAGVWFSVAYLKTRTLWFPFGLHLMWNWFQGAIFGIEVSGITELTSAPLMREIDGGPVWLTGASYGIEGGILCTVALIFSTLLIWFLPTLKPTEEMLTLTNQEAEKDTTFNA